MPGWRRTYDVRDPDDVHVRSDPQEVIAAWCAFHAQVTMSVRVRRMSQSRSQAARSPEAT